MRNGPNNNKRMRNRNNNNNNNNNRRGQNPMTRVFESNGPDIKIRGTASHVAEKYVQLARDARTSGDPVAAENYYQHAEHYFRLIAAAQEQFRQSQPQQQPRPEGEAVSVQTEDADDGENFSNFGQEPGFVPQPQQQQPQFQPRDSQPYQQRDNQQPRDNNREQRDHHRPQQQPAMQNAGDVDRLPSFITGGAQPQPNGNGFEGGDDRFNNRRRRRPHGPRPEGQSAPAPGDEFGPGSE
ncbi:MAG: DUF4167 domain-containing protein [Pseudomonadota bacterium]